MKTFKQLIAEIKAYPEVDHMPGKTMSVANANKQMSDVHSAWAAGAAERAAGRKRAEEAKKRSHTSVNEGYNERVHSFVKDTVKEPDTKENIEKHFENNSKTSKHSAEGKVGGKAWSDFKKDAHAKAKELGLVARKKAPPRAPYKIQKHNSRYYDDHVPVSHEDIHHLANKISDSIGNSYPDGDPHEHIASHMRKKGWDVYNGFDKLVPIAMKKHLQHKGDLHSLIHQNWKDFDDQTGHKAAHHWE
jgi:hypothetical protein